jgi:outer membrane autotransporter protein
LFFLFFLQIGQAMNKGFKIVWNHVRHAYVVTSETAKAYGKKETRALLKSASMLTLVLCVPAAWAEKDSPSHTSAALPWMEPHEERGKKEQTEWRKNKEKEIKQELENGIREELEVVGKTLEKVGVFMVEHANLASSSPSPHPSSAPDTGPTITETAADETLLTRATLKETEVKAGAQAGGASDTTPAPNPPITMVLTDGQGSVANLTNAHISITGRHHDLLENKVKIVFDGDQLTIPHAHPDLRAAIFLNSGQTTVGDVAALGKSHISLHEKATLNFASAKGELTSTLAGEGMIGIDPHSHITLPRDNNSSAFIGKTIVAGTLVVNGELGGTVTVRPQARVQGSGTMDTLVVLGKGTFAPGNSIGNPTIKKYLKLEDESVLEIEIAPDGRSDHVEVAGKAELGRTHLVVIGDGSNHYKVNTQYTILTAREGVFGSFIDMKKESLPFIDLALNQDDNHVYLNITRNNKTLAEVAATSNQAAVAKEISLLSGGELYGLIVNSPSMSVVQRAYDLLSGEMYASQQSFFINDSHHVRETAIDRLHKKAAPNDQPSAWGKGYGDWGNYAGTGNAAKLSYHQSGILAGTEGVNNNWLIGVLGGYGHSRLKVNDRHSRAKVDSYHIGLYTGTQAEQWNIRLGTGYSWNKTALTRHPEVNRRSFTNNADYRTHTLQFFGELSYPLHFDQIAIEPMLNIAHVRVKSPAFKEGGDNITALQSESQHNQVTFSTLGVQATKNLTVQRTEVMLQGGLGWRHAYGDVRPTTRLTFTGSNPSTVKGVAVARDTAVINAGAALQVGKHARVGLHYAGNIAKKAHENSVQANITWRF